MRPAHLSPRHAQPVQAGWRHSLLAMLLAVSFAPAAHAGLFDDTEARRQIVELKEQVGKLEDMARGQLDLVNQIEALRADLARLQGQVEVLTYESETNQKRQRDFYVDLDTRLRKLETPAAVPAGDKPAEAEGSLPAAAAKTADPQAETKDYETALNFVKASKYKEAAAAFDGFVKNYPSSPLAPSAQFWLGNSYYALHDCKKSQEAQQVVVHRWPDTPKAPDALLSISSCQQELGDAKASRKTLELLVSKYPNSPAADSARKQLKKK